MTYIMLGARSLANYPVPGLNVFGRRLGNYKNWRDDLAGIICEYQAWVETQGLGNGADDLRIYELIDALKSDKLTIALVAEFSRGKTELINAIFFSEYKQRLLPSEPGRTTMCPNELMYNPLEPSCIKLLPIETRKTTITINEYKRSNTHWVIHPLEIDQPKRMVEIFKQIIQTKAVRVQEAEELGLYDRRIASGITPQSDGKIRIPVWRHAVINFPHPLLKQGLVIIDTPGLNSLGTEPELTMHMLPNAHAVLFVLAADAGVTRSDLEIWNNHIRNIGGATRASRFVVLNKIDALWDELRSEQAITSTIENQTKETARVLDVREDNIFPVSAQKGLISKIKMDSAMLSKSGLQMLEQKLSNDVINAKQEFLRGKIVQDVGSIVDGTKVIIETRLKAVDRQLAELNSLNGEGHEAIQALMSQIREEKHEYDRTLSNFQATRIVLSEKIKVLLDYVDAEGFDRLIQKTRKEMNESWTTHGLQIGMKTLFDSALASMQKAEQQSQNVKSFVKEIHNKFHATHGLARIKQESFSLLPFRAQLKRLYHDTEAFRKSPIMVMTEQHFVTKKFFITLVAQARMVLNECHTAARTWANAIMSPILSQLREHKIMLDQRLDNLKKVQENIDNLNGRIHELEATQQNLENQLLIIRNMLRKLEQPLH